MIKSSAKGGEIANKIGAFPRPCYFYSYEEVDCNPFPTFSLLIST